MVRPLLLMDVQNELFAADSHARGFLRSSAGHITSANRRFRHAKAAGLGVLAALLSLAGCAAPRVSGPPCPPGAHLRGLPVEEAWLGPDLFMTTRYLYYELSGSTPAELRTLMSRVGPIDGGSHSDAYTFTYIHWSYTTADTDQACSIRSLQVELQVTYTMPEWVPSADAAPGLETSWQRFEAALAFHERGHRDLGILAARELVRELRELPVFATCDDLSRAAQLTWDARFSQLKGGHRSYDAATRHGATQGAIFP